MKEFEIKTPAGADTPSEVRDRYNVPPDAVLLKRSLDCRGSRPVRIYRFGLPEAGDEPYRLPELRQVANASPVAVVGAGPAGMFAALKLLSLGLKPIVLERGKDVHARKYDMAALSKSGIIDPDSNYCYGEGGAGAFSDGKLYTRSSKRGDNREVLHRLVQFGADPSILWEAHPHIGSDKLPQIVENIRGCVESHGGEYHFGARVCAIEGSDGAFRVCCADGRTFGASKVILATGHSARDIYEMLAGRGGALEAKGFALGVRVEHPQALMDRAQYGSAEGLAPAEYSFVRQVDGRGVFSFCMCPGGILVPSSTEEGTVVLNGMSNSARSSRWANAGVVVQIEPGDQPERYKGAFALLDYQRDIERSMFSAAAQHPLEAPAQRMTDFCRGVQSASLQPTSYHPGARSARLDRMLPAHIAGRLSRALPQVGIKGYFTAEALMLGVESRTSSPVRIPRNPDTLEYVSMPGVFPCGEGAGYSGGIVSSAIDGIRAAECASKSED